MKAIEILAAFINEGIFPAASGIMNGRQIINAGPYRAFGVKESGTEIKPNCSYLYYYGKQDDIFIYLPSDHIMWQNEDGNTLHLWEINE